MTRTLLRVTGTVQGVGFRPFVYRHAVALGLAGSVRNDSAGVLIDVEGEPERIAALTRVLVEEPPPLARVATGHVSRTPSRAASATASRIVDERRGGLAVGAGERRHRDVRRLPGRDRRSGRPPLPLPVHELHELRAALHDRAAACPTTGPRRRWPASRCAPRAAPSTTIPRDRRFHAQPNACPECGPQLAWRDPARHGAAPTATTRSPPRSTLLRAGAIVAVKGIGGYHLAVDATDAGAVRELRRRKARDDKPFAVMVPRSRRRARARASSTTTRVAALASPRRPIVLAPRRARRVPIADAVAPGLPELGRDAAVLAAAPPAAARASAARS